MKKSASERKHIDSVVAIVMLTLMHMIAMRGHFVRRVHAAEEVGRQWPLYAITCAYSAVQPALQMESGEVAQGDVIALHSLEVCPSVAKASARGRRRRRGKR